MENLEIVKLEQDLATFQRTALDRSNKKAEHKKDNTQSFYQHRPNSVLNKSTNIYSRDTWDAYTIRRKTRPNVPGLMATYEREELVAQKCCFGNSYESDSERWIQHGPDDMNEQTKEDFISEEVENERGVLLQNISKNLQIYAKEKAKYVEWQQKAEMCQRHVEKYERRWRQNFKKFKDQLDKDAREEAKGNIRYQVDHEWCRFHNERIAKINVETAALAEKLKRLEAAIKEDKPVGTQKKTPKRFEEIHLVEAKRLQEEIMEYKKKKRIEEKQRREKAERHDHRAEMEVHFENVEEEHESNINYQVHQEWCPRYNERIEPKDCNTRLYNIIDEVHRDIANKSKAIDEQELLAELKRHQEEVMEYKKKKCIEEKKVRQRKEAQRRLKQLLRQGPETFEELNRLRRFILEISMERCRRIGKF